MKGPPTPENPFSVSCPPLLCPLVWTMPFLLQSILKMDHGQQRQIRVHVRSSAVTGGKSLPSSAHHDQALPAA